MERPRIQAARIANRCLEPHEARNSQMKNFGVRRRERFSLFCFALSLRLLLFALVHPWSADTESRFVLQGDAAGYHHLATTLLAYQRFADDASSPPNTLRTPGYPFLIAALYVVFGPRPWVVVLFQCVLDALTCLLLLSILAPRLGRRPAFAAAIMFALDPFLILYASATLLSETLFDFLLVASFLFLDRSLREQHAGRRTGQLVLAAALLGLNVLTRPVSEFLVFVFAAFVWLGRRRNTRVALVQVGLLLLAWGGWCSPL